MRVEGLETLDYFDNLLKRKRLTEQADAVTFDGEVSLSLSLVELCAHASFICLSMCPLIVIAQEPFFPERTTSIIDSSFLLQYFDLYG